MKKLYGKLVCCIIASSLVAGCDSAIEVTKEKEKEICKTEEECTQIGDKTLQKVYKKIEGLSELEKVEYYDIG
ncbi:recombinase family protein, partial [Bacillus thuringiensis]|nr:recombinase family protein [Bacillus thuringiensis]